MFSWLNFEELLIHNPIQLINPSEDIISVAMSKKQYIEFFSNKYTYNGLYYDEAMDFCLFYYADPLQSSKNGDMYAQGYIDVDMKIYRVKWLCNVSIKRPFVAPKTITAQMSFGAWLLTNDVKSYSGKDVTGTVYLDLTNCPCDVRLQFWSEQGMILGNFVKAGQKGYSTFSGKAPVITGIGNIAFYWQKTEDNDLSFSYSEFKIEEGLTPSPYKHTAYAYSADGTDRFSTVYPNLNLLNGTATLDRMYPNSSDVSVSAITKTKISGITNTVMDVKTSGNASAVGYYLTEAYNITTGETITISFMARAFDNAKVLVGFENFPNGVKVFTINNNWKLYTYTFKATTSGIFTFLIYGLDMVAGQHFQVYNPKAELSSVATPYLPSKSEVIPSDYPNYIGQYKDYTPQDSEDPASYEWSEIQDKWNVNRTEMIVNETNKTITTVLNGAIAKGTPDKSITGWQSLQPNGNYNYVQPTYSLDVTGDDFIISGYGLRGLKNG